MAVCGQARCWLKQDSPDGQYQRSTAKAAVRSAINIGLQLERIRLQLKRQSGWTALRRRGHRSAMESVVGVCMPARVSSFCTQLTLHLAPARRPRELVHAAFQYPSRHHANVPNSMSFVGTPHAV